MKKIKLTALTGICLGLLLVATGCAKDTAQAEEANNQVEVVENQKTSEDLNKEAAENDGKEKNADDKNNSEAEDEKDGEEKSYNVTLTYPSTAYIVDGDEDNKKVTEQVTVTATKDDVITKVLDQLSQAPETEGAEPVGLDKFDYSKSKLDGTTAVVDLSGDLTGGSLDEDVLARSIVNSLLSVKGIKAVEFTVNGEKAESLMGHVDISEPFTKNL
ncbi:GerMN domain-containing protein [Aedoeadaptatus pacaensis]|uniref:GerMN domain-containing protein n=1 Tax=Aedoeadaptatus pacaensis TaxID=1776390 RepID=UPI000837D9EA|nr:GerMN domain-containing protein [Peptoniphilus pacaensis]